MPIFSDMTAFKNFGIGVDIENIERFRVFTDPSDSSFIRRIYTNKEIDYCYSKEDPAPHLSVRYSAKEAVVKALSSLGIDQVDYKDIEITNNSNGIPFVTLNNSSVKQIEIKISLSHSKDNSIAFAIVVEKQ